MLAIDRRGKRLAFLVLDPAEVRAAGTEVAPPGALYAVVTRLLRREKPSVIAAESPVLAHRIRAACPPVPVVALRTAPADARVLATLFPEAAVFAPTPQLQRLARVALTVLLSTNVIPPRTYAPRCNPAPLRPERAS